MQYLGGHERYRPECDLAYDNQLMVMLWSALATRDVRLAEHALARRRPAPLPAAWVCYVRCHDDIGWAVTDADAAAAGLDGFAHRRFLSEFYAGRYPGSYARGAVFGANAATGDMRISGTTASLCGIDRALADGDEAGLAAAIRRLESMYAVAFSFGGIPLVYMGDELALRNDAGWAADPAHAPDNRWMHRPPMDWAAAARRADPQTLEGRVFAALRGLAAARRGLLALRSGGQTTILPTGHPSVLGYRRAHPRSSPLLALTNFSDSAVSVDAGVLEPGRAAPAGGGALEQWPARPRPGPDRPARLGLRLDHRDLTRPGGLQRCVQGSLEVVVQGEGLWRDERQEVAVDRAADAGGRVDPEVGVAGAVPPARHPDPPSRIRPGLGWAGYGADPGADHRLCR